MSTQMVILDGAPGLQKNGVLDYLSSRLHASFCYEDFVSEWSTVPHPMTRTPNSLFYKLIDCPPNDLDQKSKIHLQLQTLACTYYWSRLKEAKQVGQEQNADFIFLEKGLVSVRMMQKLQMASMTEEDYYVAKKLIKTLCREEEKYVRVVLVTEESDLRKKLTLQGVPSNQMDFALKLNKLFIQEGEKHLNWEMINTCDKSIEHIGKEAAMKIVSFRQEEMDLYDYGEILEWSEEEHCQDEDPESYVEDVSESKLDQ
jgi:hypothetical protein